MANFRVMWVVASFVAIPPISVSKADDSNAQRLIDAGVEITTKTFFAFSSRYPEGNILSEDDNGVAVVVPSFVRTPYLDSKDRLYMSTSEDKHLSDQSQQVIRRSKELKTTEQYSFEMVISDIASLENVRSVSCQYTPINSQQVIRLCERHPKVVCWELGGCEIDDSAMSSLVRLKELRHLDLSDTLVSSNGLRILEEAQALESVSLGGCNVDDESVARLVGKLARLRFICVHGTKISTNAVAAMSVHRHLTLVDISDTSVDDSDVEPILTNGRIQELFADGTGVTNATIEKASGCNSLKVLSVRRSGVDESGILSMATRSPNVVINPKFQRRSEKFFEELRNGAQN
ncbi:MAG: hypothetical protein R3E01_35125 [Pirellulaceae bacterium]